MTDKQSPAEVYLASLDDGVAVVRIDRQMPRMPSTVLFGVSLPRCFYL